MEAVAYRSDSGVASYIVTLFGRLYGSCAFEEIIQLQKGRPFNKAFGTLIGVGASHLKFESDYDRNRPGISYSSILLERLKDKTRLILKQKLALGDIVEEIRGWKGDKGYTKEYYIYRANGEVLSRHYVKDAHTKVSVSYDALPTLLLG